MTVALIIAGGVGSRMGADIPKQFVRVNGKPVLIYTLEAFERHPMVDTIEVVCVEGWEDSVRASAKQFGISKLRGIVKGGATAQESIRNGVFALEGKCVEDDVIIVHDGVRPVLDTAVLDDVICTARRLGNAVMSMPYNEQIFLVDPERPTTTTKYIPRETLRRVSTPQAYRFGLLDEKYHEAFKKGIGVYGASYANTMMVELGVRLNFASGSDRNIKLTTPGDIDIFKALLSVEKSRWER